MDTQFPISANILEKLDAEVYKWVHTLTEDEIIRMINNCYYKTKTETSNNIIGFLNIEIDKEKEKTKELEELRRRNKCLENGEEYIPEDFMIDEEYDSKTNMKKPYGMLKSLVQKPSILGKQGEDSFEVLCKKLSNQYNLISTAKLGNQGDFILEYINNGMIYKCLIEVKNYSGTVPKKEVDKFYKDLNGSLFNAGIILSKRSKFPHISDSICIIDSYMSHGKIPVMFLSNISNDLILKCIEILFFKITIIREKTFEFSQIENILININNTLEHSSATRRILMEYQTTSSKAITSSLNNLNLLESKISDSLTHINKIMNTEPKNNLVLYNDINNDINNNNDNDDALSVISYETTNSYKTNSTITTVEDYDFNEKQNTQITNQENDQISNQENNQITNQENNQVSNQDNTINTINTNTNQTNEKQNTQITNEKQNDKKFKLYNGLILKHKNIKKLPSKEQTKLHEKYIKKYKTSDIKKLYALFELNWDFILNDEKSYICMKDNIIIFIDPFKSKSVMYLDFIDENNLSAEEKKLKSHFKIGKSERLKADMTLKILNDIYGILTI